MLHSTFLKQAVVTGGAGFIGSHLVDLLVADNWDVTVIDNLTTGAKHNIAHHGDRVRLVEGSITDSSLLARAIPEGATVWHFAAMNSVPQSIEDPLSTHDINCNGTLAVLLAAREKKARRFIYSGSSSAYGDIAIEVKDESIPAQPISPYGLSKFVGEEYARLFSELYGLSTVVLRYFNVFGPRQNPTSPYSAVIPKFIAALLEDRPITIYGDGEQSRDFTYVTNVAQANFLAGTKESAESGIYNVACGESISLNQVVCELEKVSSYSFQVNHEPARVGDIRSSKASIAKIHDKLGYTPLVTFSEGVKNSLEWYSTNQGYFV